MIITSQAQPSLQTILAIFFLAASCHVMPSFVDGAAVPTCRNCTQTNAALSAELPNIMLCDGSLPDELRAARYDCIMNETSTTVREVREKCQKKLFSSLSTVQFLDEMCLNSEMKANFKKCLFDELDSAKGNNTREVESWRSIQSTRGQKVSSRSHHTSTNRSPPGIPSYKSYVKCFVKTKTSLEMDDKNSTRA